MSINIITPGLMSIIVDMGRVGYQSIGYCQSGPMDDDAFFWANYLVENNAATPCIEVLGEMTVVAKSNVCAAITGKQVQAKINGNACSVFETLVLKEGDTLTFGSQTLGCRAYLSLAGDWNVPLSMNSACCVVREKIGGLYGNGKPLSAGDSLLVKNHRIVRNVRCLEEANRPDYTLDKPISVVSGYQLNNFPCASQRIFTTSKYTVTQDISRMGYRLSGAPVKHNISSMRSEAIHLGAVQIPPNGQPIIMMRDRQTLGGYPKLGCVSPIDINRLAQASPGDTITFTFNDKENERAKFLLRQHKRRKLTGDKV